MITIEELAYETGQLFSISVTPMVRRSLKKNLQDELSFEEI